MPNDTDQIDPAEIMAREGCAAGMHGHCPADQRCGCRMDADRTIRALERAGYTIVKKEGRLNIMTTDKPTENLVSIFAGKPDARQSTTETPGYSLFRKRYRQLSADDLALHDRLKDKADELARLFHEVAPIHLGPVADREKGANMQIAIRHLEDAVYRAVKALTA